MKRKKLMTALMCTVCLAVAAPDVVFAEETEAVTEVNTEGAAEAETEGTEETEAVPERPEYTALDHVTLGEYKGLNVQLDLSIAEEEVDEELRYYIQIADVMETVTEGTVEDGDTANIDYEGKLNGEAFDGGTAKDYNLEIGSGSFIEGFEEGLIGVAIGDTVDLNLTFPENYFSADLAGKEVVFTVTVNEVQRMPEVTDDLINTITEGEYTDVESYKAYIRSYLEEDKESQRDSIIKSELLTQIANTCEITSYPEEMVNYGVSQMEAAYKEYAESYEMEYEDFLTMYFGMTLEEFQEEALLAVQQNLQQELYLKAIAEAEGIEITEDEYAAGCEEYAALYGLESGEELVKTYGEGVVRISILQEKVLDYLVENAVVETVGESETEAVTETEA